MRCSVLTVCSTPAGGSDARRVLTREEAHPASPTARPPTRQRFHRHIRNMVAPPGCISYAASSRAARIVDSGPDVFTVHRRYDNADADFVIGCGIGIDSAECADSRDRSQDPARAARTGLRFEPHWLTAELRWGARRTLSFSGCRLERMVNCLACFCVGRLSWAVQFGRAGRPDLQIKRTRKVRRAPASLSRRGPVWSFIESGRSDRGLSDQPK